MLNPMEIKFIAYSDIHHALLRSRAITLKDTLELEQQIFNRAMTGGFHFVLFCGDRFHHRNPEDEAKTKADFLLWNYVNQPSFPEFFMLVGNHDYYDKSLNWHSLGSLSPFQQKIRVMDKAQTYQSINGLPVLIHALPADHEMDFTKYTPDQRYLNLFTFHDAINGAYTNDDRTLRLQTGLHLSDIDHSEFNYVFGGDIHVPQKLQLKNTRGGYIGSVIQDTKASANRGRGWIEATATFTDKWNVELAFVQTKQIFKRIDFNVDANTQFDHLKIDENEIDGQAVEVRLIGKKEDVLRLKADERWSNYETWMNPRSLTISPIYKTEQHEVVVDMSESTDASKDLKFYLDSGFVTLNDQQKEAIMSVLEELK